MSIQNTQPKRGKAPFVDVNVLAQDPDPNDEYKGDQDEHVTRPGQFFHPRGLKGLSKNEISQVMKRMAEHIKTIRESSEKKESGMGALLAAVDTVSDGGKHEAPSPKSDQKNAKHEAPSPKSDQKNAKRKLEDSAEKPPPKKAKVDPEEGEVKVVRITEFKFRYHSPRSCDVNSRDRPDDNDDDADYVPPTPVAVPQPLRAPVAEPLSIRIPEFEGEPVSVPVPVAEPLYIRIPEFKGEPVSVPVPVEDHKVLDYPVIVIPDSDDEEILSDSDEETDDEIPPNRICNTDDDEEILSDDEIPPVMDAARPAPATIDHLIGMVNARDEPQSNSDTDMDDDESNSDTDMDDDESEGDDDAKETPTYEELTQLRSNAHQHLRNLQDRANNEPTYRDDLKDLKESYSDLKEELDSIIEWAKHYKRQTYGAAQRAKRDIDFRARFLRTGNVGAAAVQGKIIQASADTARRRDRIIRNMNRSISRMKGSLEAITRQITDIRQEIRSFQPDEITRALATYEKARTACYMISREHRHSA